MCSDSEIQIRNTCFAVSKTQGSLRQVCSSVSYAHQTPLMHKWDESVDILQDVTKVKWPFFIIQS